MSWKDTFPVSRSKQSLMNGSILSLTDTPPVPLARGLFEVEVLIQKEEKIVSVIMTRKDLSIIIESDCKPFMIVPDPKNPEWGNVEPVEKA